MSTTAHVRHAPGAARRSAGASSTMRPRRRLLGPLNPHFARASNEPRCAPTAPVPEPTIDADPSQFRYIRNPDGTLSVRAKSPPPSPKLPHYRSAGGGFLCFPLPDGVLDELPSPPNLAPSPSSPTADPRPGRPPRLQPSTPQPRTPAGEPARRMTDADSRRSELDRSLGDRTVPTTPTPRAGSSAAAVQPPASAVATRSAMQVVATDRPVRAGSPLSQALSRLAPPELLLVVVGDGAEEAAVREAIAAVEVAERQPSGVPALLPPSMAAPLSPAAGPPQSTATGAAAAGSGGVDHSTRASAVPPADISADSVASRRSPPSSARPAPASPPRSVHPAAAASTRATTPVRATVVPPYATTPAPDLAASAARPRRHMPSTLPTGFVLGDFSYENLLRLDAQRESCGLSPAQYERVRRLVPAAVCVNADCSVCLEPFPATAGGDAPALVVRLACGHGFHEACIVQWLRREKRCPNCRHQVVPD